MFRHRDQGVRGIRWNARSRNMGAPLGALSEAPPYAFYDVHGPVNASPGDLQDRVEIVKANIEAGGTWKVWTYSTGATGSSSVQTVRFTVYRPDKKGTAPTNFDSATAEAVVQAACLKANFSLGPLKDWASEFNAQVIQPSIQQGKQAAQNPLSVPLPTWVKGVAIGGIALYVLNSLVRAKRAFGGR